MTSLPTVAVSAAVEREVLPDSFVLTARVSARAADSGTVLAALVARYGELESAVDALPDSVDVRHGAVSNWREGGRGRTWHAMRAMTLTGTDLATVGDAANAIGSVTDVAIDGPMWQVDRDNPAYVELQAEAVHEARARAERYATALGGRLGRLVELSDPGQAGGRFHAQAAQVSAGGGAPELASLDLAPQPIEISASVNATWSLVLPD